MMVFLTPANGYLTRHPSKNWFPKEFWHETCTIYLYTFKTTINQKKNQNHLLFRNGGQYTNFHFVKTVT